MICPRVLLHPHLLVLSSLTISANLHFSLYLLKMAILSPGGLHILFPWLYPLPLTGVFSNISAHAQAHVLNTWFSAGDTIWGRSGNFRR